MADLSSMTSLSTFIMATDCSSVKPSSWRRCTKRRVSKWWSRLRVAEAWNARRRAGLRTTMLLFGRCPAGRLRLLPSRGPPLFLAGLTPAVWRLLLDAGCHSAPLDASLACRKTTAEALGMAVAAEVGTERGPDQLRRGSRNRGRFCAGFMFVLCVFRPSGKPRKHGQRVCQREVPELVLPRFGRR